MLGHKRRGQLELFITLKLLPPYSPDLNPIEMPSRNSKHTYAASEPETSATCSMLSHKSAISSHRTSVGSTSRLLDMSQVKSGML